MPSVGSFTGTLLGDNSRRKKRFDFPGWGGEGGLLGRGEERVIMCHLLLERLAAVGLPTWGLKALTTPRPTVIFPGVRVSLANTPGKLSLTLCLAPQRISGGRERHRAALCLSVNALLHPTQAGESLGKPLEGLHLSQCSGQVTI